MSPSSVTADFSQERDVRAGEYVLGLIEGAELVAFTRELETDSSLVASVERWRGHFIEIDELTQPISPPAALWSRIEAGLAATTQAAATNRIEASPAIQPAPARPIPARSMAKPGAGGRLADWWNSLFVWRGAAMAGALAAIVLAVGLVGALDKAKRQPVMVAVLLTEASLAAAVVNTFADGRVEMVPLQAIHVPEGKALEIWTLWDRAVGPRSVGLIERARSTNLRLDQLPLGNGQLFEITLEPATGSPTGRPTGPIVAKGTTSQAL